MIARGSPALQSGGLELDPSPARCPTQATLAYAGPPLGGGRGAKTTCHTRSLTSMSSRGVRAWYRYQPCRGDTGNRCANHHMSQLQSAAHHGGELHQPSHVGYGIETQRRSHHATLVRRGESSLAEEPREDGPQAIFPPFAPEQWTCEPGVMTSLRDGQDNGLASQPQTTPTHCKPRRGATKARAP